MDIFEQFYLFLRYNLSQKDLFQMKYLEKKHFTKKKLSSQQKKNISSKKNPH